MWSETRNKIKQSGGRISLAREFLISKLCSKDCLISKKEIEDFMFSMKKQPNRSTLYRDLKYLEETKIIKKVIISGEEYFELNDNHDHHHLICENCNEIKMIDIGNHLDNEISQIQDKFNFNINYHILDFYGLCQKCKK